MSPNRFTPRHITIKMPKVKYKERILKQQEKSSWLPTREFPLSADFSKETLQARRNWQEMFKGMKRKGLQPTVL